jgi:predicted PhzF superfamily epimerase YddE/YHI9
MEEGSGILDSSLDRRRLLSDLPESAPVKVGRQKKRAASETADGASGSADAALANKADAKKRPSSGAAKTIVVADAMLGRSGPVKVKAEEKRPAEEIKVEAAAPETRKNVPRKRTKRESAV